MRITVNSEFAPFEQMITWRKRRSRQWKEALNDSLCADSLWVYIVRPKGVTNNPWNRGFMGQASD